MYVYIHIYTNIYIYIYIYTHIHLCIHIHLYIYIYVCVYRCIGDNVEQKANYYLGFRVIGNKGICRKSRVLWGLCSHIPSTVTDSK